MSKKNKRMHEIFNSFKDEAEEVFRDKNKMDSVLKSVKTKLGDVKDLDHKFSLFKSKMYTLVRMFRYTIKGQYKGLAVKSIVLIVMGFLYFLSPIDFIPDFIAGLGLIDDITIILWIYNSLKLDVDDFEAWESEQAIAINTKPDKN